MEMIAVGLESMEFDVISHTPIDYMVNELVKHKVQS